MGRSSDLRNSDLVLLVHYSLDHGMCGVQARLLLHYQSEVERGRIDPGCLMGLAGVHSMMEGVFED